MEARNTGPDGSATVTPEVWAQMTAYAQNLLADTERLKEQLAATQLQIGRCQGGPKLNKPNTFSGKFGTVDTWVSHMDQ